VEVVDDHHIHAAVERGRVAPYVWLEGGLGIEKPVGAVDVNIDEGERRDGLGLTVFEDFEVVLCQIADEMPVVVRDRGVHLDILDADAERGELRSGRAGRLP
jgi:hypothetical protein